MILTGTSIDNAIKKNQIGYYTVGEQTFLNKYQALLSATSTKKPIEYHWFDDEYDRFDRSTLGTRNLQQLYKQRAEQLRSKYDYLILNYSGGADSWNILKTFLDNNIKLDQIMVSWPFSAVEAQLYKANTKDTSAYNFMSEWDFTTKPDLDWLSKNHPNIKIELIDWADPFVKDKNFVTEEVFGQLNHFHNLADLARSTLYSEVERKLCEQGVKVGTIWGLDKPKIYNTGNNNLAITFPDSVITVAHAPVWNLNGTEYFYWAPEMPEIAFEMAYQTVQWFRARPTFQKWIWKAGQINNPYSVFVQMAQTATISTCYDNWDAKENKFQVGKSLRHNRDDKDFWLYKTPELEHHVKRWEVLYNDHLTSISSDYTRLSAEQTLAGYSTIYSKMHYLCKL